jgi:hypothetical protein
MASAARPMSDVEQDHDKALADGRMAVVQTEQGEHRVDDHRRRQQVEPEGDVGTAGQARRIGRIPAHREQENADPEKEDEAEDQVAPGLHAFAQGGNQQADGDGRDRGSAGGDRDRNPERFQ